MQHSQESLRALSKSYGINQKTVAKWKKRGSAADLPAGPKEPRSTVLSMEEEAIVVAFRRHGLPPLEFERQANDPGIVCREERLYAPRATIPRLTRSSRHRCPRRHVISQLPDVEGDRPARKKFKAYPIGSFHIGIAEARTAEGKLCLYVAIDRASKFAFVRVVRETGRTSAPAFLSALIAAVAYKIHTVLTDNGVQFTFPPRCADGPTARYMTHMFDMRGRENGIEHRLTKVKHPWTNGQVERMNRAIKEGEAGQKTIRGIVFPLNVKRFHYDDHRRFETHLANFVSAYNFARPLNTLGGLTPYEFICECWTNEPERFSLEPIHQMPGLNN